MHNNRSIRIEMDEPAHELLLRVKKAIIERNRDSVSAVGYEPATLKAILQRGVAAVARELNLPADAI